MYSTKTSKENEDKNLRIRGANKKKKTKRISLNNGWQKANSITRLGGKGQWTFQ